MKLVVVLAAGSMMGCLELSSMQSASSSGSSYEMSAADDSMTIQLGTRSATVMSVNGVEAERWHQLDSGARILWRDNGKLVYNPRGLFDRLAAGETHVETITYEFVDNNGRTGTAEITIRVTKDSDDRAPDNTESPSEDPVEDPKQQPEPEPEPEVETPTEPAPEIPDNDGKGGGGGPAPTPEMPDMDHGGSGGGGGPAPTPEMPDMDHGDSGDHNDGGMDHGDNGHQHDGSYQHYQLIRGSAMRVSEFRVGPFDGLSHHGSRHHCLVSHYSYDDPVVYPGEPGRAHLHMFFGNTGADYASTSQSIANSGNSTCWGGIVNRSAYWAPAFFNENDEVVLPHTLMIYYKSWVNDRTQLQPIPVGLQMLANRNVQNAGPWHFSHSDHDGIYMSIDFPNCVAVGFDGQPVLSSPGGTSHLAYSSGSCPASHPYMIPTMTININYRLDYNSGWYLASDSSTATKGESLHADYIAGWTEEAMAQITQCVIDGNSSCGPRDQVQDPSRLLAPDGTQVYANEWEFAPTMDLTPFGSSLPKSLHMMSGH